MAAQARRTGRSRRPARDAARSRLPLVDALVDQCNGRNRKAAWELFLLRDRAPRFGGSHAQRDLISQTLLACAVASGDAVLATHMAQERLAVKPGTPLTGYWMGAARGAGVH